MLEVALFLFLIGLAIGSFLNVVIYRLVHGDSPLRGRSYCDHCKKPIAWYDNIPLFSFIVLRQRCRYCHTKIPWEYPAVELLTGTLFVWWYIVGFTFFQLSNGPLSIIQPIFWLTVGVLFVVITFTDITYMIIPDSTVLILSVSALLYRIYLTSISVMQPQDLLYSVVMATLASLFLFGLFLLTKGKGMGFGDVKLIFPLGIIVGFPDLLIAFFVACISGAIVGMVMMYWKSKKITGVIPFGPFLILGSVVALVWGNTLLHWYLSFL